MSEFFSPSAVFRAPATGEKGIFILCSGGRAAVLEDHPLPPEAVYIGELSGCGCFAAPAESAPEGIEPAPLRDIISTLSTARRQAVCRAGTVAHWRSQHRFCGICGRELELSAGDESLLCSECSAVYFPQIAPAIIVAVEKDDKLLLARNSRSRNGMFGLVAGFVGAGESLEDAVRRELAEEVGIEVCDIAYSGSQSWPFPNSLMIGFTARWKSGEVTPDGREIVEAGFYAPDEFPLIPSGGSIARRLIDEFTAGVSGKNR